MKRKAPFCICGSLLLALSISGSGSGDLQNASNRHFTQPATAASGSGSGTQGIGRNIFAPEIVIVSPETLESEVTTDLTVVRGVVLSYKFELTEVVFSLNGAVIQKSKLTPETRNRLPFEVTLKLTPGANVFSVTAANDKASWKEVRRVLFSPRSASTKPNLAVLAIGISKYKRPSLSVKFAERDAADFLVKLKKQEGCVFKSITTSVLLNENATRDGILKALTWLNEAAPSDSDVRMLYFSGLNAKDYSGNYYLLSAEHEDEKDLEFYDLRYETVFERLAKAPNRVIVFVDTAYGGPAYSFTASGQRLFRAEAFGNVTAYFSFAGGQASADTESWGHSAFSKALFEALNGKTDLPQNENIDTNELQKWIIGRVSTLTEKKQTVAVVGLKDNPVPLFCGQP